jgi:hypothetical protein
MVSVLASSTVDRGFEPRSGQNKDYKIGICEDIYFVQMLLNMKSIVIITGYYYLLISTFRVFDFSSSKKINYDEKANTGSRN